VSSAPDIIFPKVYSSLTVVAFAIILQTALLPQSCRSVQVVSSIAAGAVQVTIFLAQGAKFAAKLLGNGLAAVRAMALGGSAASIAVWVNKAHVSGTCIRLIDNGIILWARLQVSRHISEGSNEPLFLVIACHQYRRSGSHRRTHHRLLIQNEALVTPKTVLLFVVWAMGCCRTYTIRTFALVGIALTCVSIQPVAEIAIGAQCLSIRRTVDTLRAIPVITNALSVNAHLLVIVKHEAIVAGVAHLAIVYGARRVLGTISVRAGAYVHLAQVVLKVVTVISAGRAMLRAVRRAVSGYRTYAMRASALPSLTNDVTILIVCIDCTWSWLAFKRSHACGSVARIYAFNVAV
jgi:hypothetical protein